jgi:hypothetical protein
MYMDTERRAQGSPPAREQTNEEERKLVIAGTPAK